MRPASSNRPSPDAAAHRDGADRRPGSPATRMPCCGRRQPRGDAGGELLQRQRSPVAADAAQARCPRGRRPGHEGLVRHHPETAGERVARHPGSARSALVWAACSAHPPAMSRCTSAALRIVGRYAVDRAQKQRVVGDEQVGARCAAPRRRPAAPGPPRRAPGARAPVGRRRPGPRRPSPRPSPGRSGRSSGAATSASVGAWSGCPGTARHPPAPVDGGTGSRSLAPALSLRPRRRQVARRPRTRRADAGDLTPPSTEDAGMRASGPLRAAGARPVPPGRGAEDAAAFCARLREATHDVGFFYLTGHGVPTALEARLHTAARDFFALPEAEKLAIENVKQPALPRLHPVGGELHPGQGRLARADRHRPGARAIADGPAPDLLGAEGPEPVAGRAARAARGRPDWDDRLCRRRR